MVVLPPRLFPPAPYYHWLAGDDGLRVVVDTAARYDKRCKAAHRYDIIDVRGALQLTVPLGKPHGMNGRATWNDAPVSTHDQWWTRHRSALESAYGRTPYFEFIIDRFDGVFRSPERWDQWPSAIDLIREANAAVCHILAVDAPEYADASVLCASIGADGQEGGSSAALTDCRTDRFAISGQPAYWQVRSNVHGFCPGLSILDILFNLGPEASLYLRDMHRSLARE